jgi:hypothetical protein
MQGVEILTSAQVVTERTFNWADFSVVSLTIFVLLLIVGILYSLAENELGPCIVFTIAGIIFGGIFGCLVGGIFQTPTAHETQYKITISDEVSMTEFYEHYEVIEQDGKIFTVREKTNE